MKDLLHLICAALVPCVMMAWIGVPFEPTLSKALEISAQEERPLMLLFISESCPDCASVEQYLASAEVQALITERFVAARVNIADFDGMACSEIYGVELVPALVVVDSKGGIIYKAQGTVNLDELSMIIRPGSSTSDKPERQIEPDPKTIQVTHDELAVKANAELIQRDAIEPPQPKLTSAPKSEETRPMTPKHREYIIGNKSYSLQFGFYSTEENADRMIQRIRDYGLTDAHTVTVHRNGQTFYRVLWGKFPSAEIADEESSPIKTAGFEVKVHRNQ